MNLQIDPKWDTIISVAVALLYFAAQGNQALPLGIPHEWGPYIQSWANWLIGLYLVIAPFFPALSAAKPGPLVATPPKR